MNKPNGGLEVLPSREVRKRLSEVISKTESGNPVGISESGELKSVVVPSVDHFAYRYLIDNPGVDPREVERLAQHAREHKMQIQSAEQFRMLMGNRIGKIGK